MIATISDHERPQWRVLTQLDKYDGVCVDEYRNRYGKTEGEARFFAENRPTSRIVRPDNLLLIGGASVLWECLIGNGTSTASQALTYFNNSNANIGVGDGGPAALTGTASVTNGSATVTFSASQSSLLNNYLTFVGDSSNGVYKVTAGSGTSWTMSPVYGGSTNGTASASTITGEVANQTDLQASSNKTRNAVDASYPLHTDQTGSSAIAVSAASNASPIVITTGSAHGLTTGNFVAISGVGGNTNANGIWQVTVTDTTHFSLNNSSGNAAYTSGGYMAVSPVLVFKSTFGTSAANYTWMEWGLASSSSGGRMLNRKVTSLGTKTNAASWAFTVGVGLQ